MAAPSEVGVQARSSSRRSCAARPDSQSSHRGHGGQLARPGKHTGRRGPGTHQGRPTRPPRPAGPPPQRGGQGGGPGHPGPAGPIPVRIYWPLGATGTPPLVIYFHGGGWVICDLDSHDGGCRALANETGSVVVSVDYRLAPEHRFPAAAEDSYAATVWAAEHATELGADANRHAVAGDSAGGNLAAVVALMARDRNGPTAAFSASRLPGDRRVPRPRPSPVPDRQRHRLLPHDQRHGLVPRPSTCPRARTAAIRTCHRSWPTM